MNDLLNEEQNLGLNFAAIKLYDIGSLELFIQMPSREHSEKLFKKP